MREEFFFRMWDYLRAKQSVEKKVTGIENNNWRTRHRAHRFAGVRAAEGRGGERRGELGEMPRATKEVVLFAQTIPG